MSASFNLLSLNVRGLSNRKKRRVIFTWCRKKRSDMILLQETHSSRDKEQFWKNEWGGNIVFSHGKSNARGVAILFRNDLDYEILNTVIDNNGRFILITVKIQDVVYKIGNVYGPNNEGKAIDFYKNISQLLVNEDVNMDDNIMLGGDFNCVLNPLLDKRGGSMLPKYKLIE